jgi:hypothetical protein
MSMNRYCKFGNMLERGASGLQYTLLNGVQEAYIFTERVEGETIFPRESGRRDSLP